MKKIMIQAGKKLKTFREQAGYPIEYVSAMTGIAERKILRLENGKYDIPINELAELLEVYGIRTSDFIGEF